VPSYLDASMETFVRNQEQMREQMSSAFAANPALEGMEAMARTNMEWFENAMSMFSPFGSPVSSAAQPQEKPPAPESAPEASADKGDLDAMKDQLAAMQAQLSKLTEPKK